MINRVKLIVLAGLLAPGLATAASYVDIPLASVRDHAFTKDGYLLITAGNSLKQYDLAACELSTLFDASGQLYGVEVSGDENRVVVASRGVEQGSIRFLHTWRYRWRGYYPWSYLPAFGEDGSYMPAFTPGGQLLIGGTYAGSGWTPLREFDLATGTSVTRASVRQDSMLATGAESSIIGIAESNISSGPVRAYSTRSGSFQATFNTGKFMFELAINPKGSRFVAPSYAGAFVLDFENGTFTDVGRLGQQASHGPLSSVFSPDSTKLITANWSFSLPAEQGVRILDAQTLQTLSIIDNYPFSWNGNRALGPGRLTLSRDGEWLAVTIANGVRLYDVGMELNGRSAGGCAHRQIDTQIQLAPPGPQLGPADFDSYGRPISATD